MSNLLPRNPWISESVLALFGETARDNRRSSNGSSSSSNSGIGVHRDDAAERLQRLLQPPPLQVIEFCPTEPRMSFILSDGFNMIRAPIVQASVERHEHNYPSTPVAQLQGCMISIKEAMLQYDMYEDLNQTLSAKDSAAKMWPVEWILRVDDWCVLDTAASVVYKNQQDRKRSPKEPGKDRQLQDCLERVMLHDKSHRAVLKEHPEDYDNEDPQRIDKEEILAIRKMLGAWRNRGLDVVDSKSTAPGDEDDGDPMTPGSGTMPADDILEEEKEDSVLRRCESQLDMECMAELQSSSSSEEEEEEEEEEGAKEAEQEDSEDGMMLSPENRQKSMSLDEQLSGVSQPTEQYAVLSQELPASVASLEAEDAAEESEDDNEEGDDLDDSGALRLEQSRVHSSGTPDRSMPSSGSSDSHSMSFGISQIVSCSSEGTTQGSQPGVPLSMGGSFDADNCTPQLEQNAPRDYRESTNSLERSGDNSTELSGNASVRRHSSFFEPLTQMPGGEERRFDFSDDDEETPNASAENNALAETPEPRVDAVTTAQHQQQPPEEDAQQAEPADRMEFDQASMEPPELDHPGNVKKPEKPKLKTKKTKTETEQKQLPSDSATSFSSDNNAKTTSNETLKFELAPPAPVQGSSRSESNFSSQDMAPPSDFPALSIQSFSSSSSSSSSSFANTNDRSPGPMSTQQVIQANALRHKRMHQRMRNDAKGGIRVQPLSLTRAPTPKSARQTPVRSSSSRRQPKSSRRGARPEILTASSPIVLSAVADIPMRSPQKRRAKGGSRKRKHTSEITTTTTATSVSIATTSEQQPRQYEGNNNGSTAPLVATTASSSSSSHQGRVLKKRRKRE